MSRDLDSLREKLLRELGEREAPAQGLAGNDFAYLYGMPDEEFRHMGLDLAVTLALQSLWQEARNCIRRYRGLDPANNSALIFEMRCSLEMESFTEVLALGQAPLTEKQHLLSANYLMALSFEALEMYPQARARYEAVIRQDSNFLDAALRLSKLQGIGGR